MPIQARYVTTAGDRLEEELPWLTQNRAWRYGDGLFETILVNEGQAIALELHTDRLISGLKILQIGAEIEDWRLEISALVEKLLKGQPAEGCGRMRISVHRAGGGTYLPETDHAVLVGEVHALPSHPWRLAPPRSVVLDHAFPLHHGLLSAVKSISALPCVLAARQARAAGFQDALRLHIDGSAAEFTASNLFAVIGGQLCTPPLSSGCLPGTMRQRTCAAATHAGIPVQEHALTPAALGTASEIFATNAVQGLQPVGSLHGSPYAPTAFPVMLQLRRLLGMPD